MMYSQSILSWRLLMIIMLAIIFGGAIPVVGAESVQTRLERGEVVVESQKTNDINFVAGRILIDEPPSHVWPVMSNPFEFQGKISPRMRQLKVMTDKVNMSLLKCTIHIGFLIPDITYVVESRYEPVERILFKRVSGNLKDFQGRWEVKPVYGGSKTELTYSMFIDTGMPIPQWIIREGIKGELPRTLVALRERINAIYVQNKAPEGHSILAASVVAKVSAVPQSQSIH